MYKMDITGHDRQVSLLAIVSAAARASGLFLVPNDVTNDLYFLSASLFSVSSSF